MKRIVVVGTMGCGKTSLAQELAQHLGVPHIELDALHWGPNWTPPPLDRFRELVARALDGDAWVADGNYSKVRDIVWGRADTLVWLDYALPTIFWRLVRRTVRRVVTREQLWNGNRETWRGAFLDSDNLFLHLLRTYRKRRRQYPQLLEKTEYGHLSLVRLRSPRAAEAWMLVQFQVTGSK